MMRFRSCLLLSRLFVFGFPLAVQKESNPEASHQLGEVLSVRDDTDSLNDFTVALPNSNRQGLFDQPPPEELTSFSAYNQPLNKDLTGLPKFGTGSLLAESATDEVGGPAAAIIGGGIGIYTFIKGAIDNLNTLISTPTRTAPLRPKGGDTTQQRETVKPGRFGSMTRLRGPGDIIRGSGTGEEGLCPSLEYENRKIVWCDSGNWDTAELVGDEITISGGPYNLVTGCGLDAYQLYWCCLDEDSVRPDTAHDCKPGDELDPRLKIILYDPPP